MAVIIIAILKDISADETVPIAKIVPARINIIPDIPGKPKPGIIASIINKIKPVTNIAREVHCECPAIILPPKKKSKGYYTNGSSNSKTWSKYFYYHAYKPYSQ